jgi:hypothetical protein
VPYLYSCSVGRDLAHLFEHVAAKGRADTKIHERIARCVVACVSVAAALPGPLLTRACVHSCRSLSNEKGDRKYPLGQHHDMREWFNSFAAAVIEGYRSKECCADLGRLFADTFGVQTKRYHVPVGVLRHCRHLVSPSCSTWR